MCIAFIGISNIDYENDKKNGVTISGPFYDYTWIGVENKINQLFKTYDKMVLPTKIVTTEYELVLRQNTNIKFSSNIKLWEHYRNNDLIDKRVIRDSMHRLLDIVYREAMSNNEIFENKIYGYYLHEEPRFWIKHEVKFVEYCVECIVEYLSLKNMNTNNLLRFIIYHPNHIFGKIIDDTTFKVKKDSDMRINFSSAYNYIVQGMYFEANISSRIELVTRMDHYNKLNTLKSKSVALSLNEQAIPPLTLEMIKHDLLICILYEIDTVFLFSFKYGNSKLYKSYMEANKIVEEEEIVILLKDCHDKFCSQIDIVNSYSVYYFKTNNEHSIFKYSQYKLEVNSHCNNEYNGIKPLSFRLTKMYTGFKKFTFFFYILIFYIAFFIQYLIYKFNAKSI